MAGARIVPDKPFPPPVQIEPAEDEAAWVTAFLSRQRQVHGILDRSEWVPIGLPHDGAHFLGESPGDCAATLQMLVGAGYNVPGHVIADLREEQAELDSSAASDRLATTPYARRA